MRASRAFGVAAAAGIVGVVVLGAMVEFLAPDLGYRIKDRAAEILSGTSGHTYRIGLGVATGSSYRVGTVLNRYLKLHAGYEMDLVPQPQAGAIGSLIGPQPSLDFAVVDSSNPAAAEAAGV